MLDAILSYFKKPTPPDSQPQPNPREALALRKTAMVDQIEKIVSLTTTLKNPMKKICERFAFYGKILLENDKLSEHDLNYLERYIPYVYKITKSHVKWRLENINSLDFFNTLVKSKQIIVRFTNALQDKCEKIKSAANLDFNAEISALDNMLKRSGF